VRTRHLAGDHGAAVDPANDLRRWRAAIAAHEAYDELVLWYEHDLFDQLNLVQVLSWIRERLPSDAVVSLICLGAFPGRPGFKGLGELAAVELAPLFDQRERVRQAQFSLAARAWDAFRAPTPDLLDDLRRGDSSDLPFLAPAVTRLLEEYPWTRDGLSRTERRLLSLAGDGPVALATAFPHMTVDGDVYHVTDLALAHLAGRLARTSPALVTADPSPAGLGAALDCIVTLTEAGRDVLAGGVDRVALCGVDHWLGGVHLQGRAGVWRWDADAQEVRRERV
jgi:hypothetical protein